MIRLEQVSVTFTPPGAAPVRALHGLSLEVAEGEALCLIGASGCGKTTALRTVNALQRPDAGRVLVNGQDVSAVDPIALRRGIGYVVQAGALFPHLTVAQNVGLLCELEGWSAARRDARVAELLELVHLPAAKFAERFPAELSGGQQQRVGVARALVLDPPVVLLDEPFGALDPVTRHELQREFLELRDAVGKTMLIVSHDLNEAFLLAQRVALLRAGELVQVGTRADFEERPADERVVRFVQDFVGERGGA